MAKKKKTELDLLAEQVSEGNAVLFLGAGASIGAKHPKDDKIPNGDELRDALSARFLSGKFGELSHPTDDNYEAQFWWARYVVLGDDEREVKEANRVFNRLRKAQMPYETRIRIRDMEPESRRFSGSVRSVGPNYCLAQVKGSSTWLLVNKTDFEDYSSVKVERSVEFSVAFSYSGLIGQSARVLD